MAHEPLRARLSEAISPMMKSPESGLVDCLVNCVANSLGASLNSTPEDTSQSVSRGPLRSERRQPRFSVGLPVVICGFGARGRIFSEFAATLDISRSGCCIHLRNRPQRDSPLAVRLTRMGDASGAVIQVLLRVMWMRPHELGLAIGAAVLDHTDLAEAALPLLGS